MGCKLNPYDLCVANSQIKGKQCTVAWYVNDNKISHVDDTVVTDILEKLEAKFGKMTVTRGNYHVFLGMDITFNENNGTVTVLIKEYLKEAITDSGMDASKVAPTPAKKDLFTVDDGSEQLDKRQGEISQLLGFQKSLYQRSIGYSFPLHQGLVQHGAGLEKVDPPIF